MDSKKNKNASPGDTSTENSTSPIAPGSVGAVSQEIGYDVRDLIMMGFTHTEVLFFSREEIMSVVDGELTLHQLRSKHNPDAQEAANHQSWVRADQESDRSEDIGKLSDHQV
jgi:hypothetical protein